MNIPTIDEWLVAFTRIMPYGIEFILALMALGGLFLIGAGLISIYNQVTDRGYGQTYGRSFTPWAALGQLLLGGALTVPLVIMWDVAGTFVAGGAATYNILSYLPPDNTRPWCEQVTSGVVLFWMLLGLIAVGWSAHLANQRIVAGPQQGSTAATLWFFFGGLACFFIVDIAAAIGNTIGLNIGFDEVCAVLGG